jgi:Hemopexin
VLFASGDLHLGYLMHRPGTVLANGKQGPDYWEVISSPLRHDIWNQTVMHGPGVPTYDPYLLEEVRTQNYGLIDVDLDRAGQEMILSLKNSEGTPCFQQTLALGSLRVRPAVHKRSAVVWNNGKAYFFRGDRYARYTMDPANEGVDPGYPQPIAGSWPGLSKIFPLDIDAVVVWPNGKAYFFKGNGYVRYTIDPAHEGVDSDLPQYIAEGWKGLWPSGVDAAVVWDSQKAYFFKGKEYVRYNIDPSNEGVDPGYPKPIQGNWPGLAEAFPDGIDAVLVWPNGKAFFFKGDRYVRYTMNPANEGVDPGYPQPIQGNWKGLEKL